MDWMLFLTVVATVTAIFAAIFGFVEANEAKKAGKAAKDSREKAEAAEAKAVAARDAAVRAQQESASAAGRIAEVLEQQAEEQRAAASVRPEPWEVRAGSSRKTGSAIVLVNASNATLQDVSMTVERRPYTVWFDPNPVPSEMQPGESVEIYWARAASDPATSTLVINWRWSDSNEMLISRVPMTR